MKLTITLTLESEDPVHLGSALGEVINVLATNPEQRRDLVNELMRQLTIKTSEAKKTDE